MGIMIVTFRQIGRALHSAIRGQFQQTIPIDRMRNFPSCRLDRDSERNIDGDFNLLIRRDHTPIEVTIELDHCIDSLAFGWRYVSLAVK